MIVERDSALSARDIAVTDSVAARSSTTDMIAEMSAYIDEHMVIMQTASDLLGRVDTLTQEITALPPSSERDAMLGLLARMYPDP